METETRETLNYKALDIYEGIKNLTSEDLKEEHKQLLKNDLKKQLEELLGLLNTI